MSSISSLFASTLKKEIQFNQKPYDECPSNKGSVVPHFNFNYINSIQLYASKIFTPISTGRITIFFQQLLKKRKPLIRLAICSNIFNLAKELTPQNKQNNTTCSGSFRLTLVQPHLIKMSIFLILFYTVSSIKCILFSINVQSKPKILWVKHIGKIFGGLLLERLAKALTKSFNLSCPIIRCKK